MTELDPGIWYRKMSQELLAATEETTLLPSWKRLYTSENQPFLYLDLRTKDGLKREPLTVMDGLSLGELTTLNTGESPSAAVESHLSQILEGRVPEKYYLSRRACQGILQRTKKKGIKLPDEIVEALSLICHM